MSSTISSNPIFHAFHARQVASPSVCRENFRHDRTSMLMSSLVIVGLVISYLPQHYRIIRNKSSDGFSPFFLLLGATSSACSMLNIVTLQWGQIECCRYLTAGQCLESTLGIIQVFLQWLCFNLIFVLYLLFFPSASKWVRSLPAAEGPPKGPSFFSFFRSTTSRSRSSSSASTASSASFDPSTILLPGQFNRHSLLHLSPAYRHSINLFSLTVLHLVSSAAVTFLLLLSLPTVAPSLPPDSPPAFPPLQHPHHPLLLNIFAASSESREHPSERAVRLWATLLGLLAVVLGVSQYLPQLLLTFRRRLVGSLSIPMMCLQVPGSFVFVYTLAVRPGVNWTGYATYLVTGVLQGSLLIMCIVWKRKQAEVGVDDWGQPVAGVSQDGPTRGQRAGERTALLA